MSTLKHVVAAMMAVGVFVAGHAYAGSTYDKPGFTTEVKDGRLWVFKAGAKEIQEFQKSGELAKLVTRIGEGPDGMTLKSPDAQTIDDYMAAKSK